MNDPNKTKKLYESKSYRDLDDRRRRIVRSVLFDRKSFGSACRLEGLNQSREKANVPLQVCLAEHVPGDYKVPPRGGLPEKSEYEQALDRRELLANFCTANPDHPAAIAFLKPPAIEHAFDPTCPNCNSDATPYEWRNGHGLCRDHRDAIRAIEHEAWAARFNACLSAAQEWSAR